MSRRASAMEYVIGVDLGTSAFKAVLMDHHGTLCARQQLGTELAPTADGSIIFDADHAVRRFFSVVGALASQCPRGSVSAVSMCAASGNAMLTGADGTPRIEAISWLDRRTEGLTSRTLPDLDPATVHPVTGWPWLEGFAFAKYAWLKHFRPCLIDEGTRFCMFIEYLVWRLCGQWVIDTSTATPSLLQDQRKRSWCGEYLKMLGITTQRMSRMLCSGTRAGSLLPSAAAECGLSSRCSLVLGCFDHPAAARALGITDTRHMLLSCGTSWVLLLPSVSRDNAISCGFRTDPFLEPGGPWAALRSLSRIGEALDFLIEGCLGSGRDAGPSKYQLFDRLAAAVDRYRRAADPASWLLIDPMEYRQASTDALQPSLAVYAREEVALAIMEGAAFCLRRELEDGTRLFARVNTIRMAGGPSESALWPQIIADILNLRVEIVHARFSGAIGAAQIAASTRFSTSGPSDSPVGGIQRVYEPDRSLQPVYSERYHAFTARHADSGQPPVAR